MTTKAATPEPEAVEATPEPVQGPDLPEGAKVLTKAPTGEWHQLVDADGENVLVDGKPVEVVR